MKRPFSAMAIMAGLSLFAALPAHAAGINTDAVNELTPDAGVTVDGVAIKDGAVTAGVWNGDAVPVANGGTGADNATDARANLNVALPATGAAHVVVQVTDNPATNGDNLRAAYAAAAALTPHASPLSATNRAVVLVPPGNYDLRWSTLTLDTDFVDIEGLSNDRDKQRIYSEITNVLTQTTALDVRIENLLLHYTGTFSFLTYYPDATWDTDHTGSPPATVIRNCEFRVDDPSNSSMRYNVEFAGTYEDCLAGGSLAFGSGSNGWASGTFTNCTGDRSAFGYAGVASGTFTNCAGGDNAFGGGGGSNGVASGTFTNCTGGDHAFGAGMASGTFTNCTGARSAFGCSLYGTASGIFTNCTAGDFAFGGWFGTASGAFTNCTGGTDSFGTHGTASGTFTNCTGGMMSFGSYGTASGTFTNCTGGMKSFGYDGNASGGKFYHCIGGVDSFTATGTPTVLYCVRDGATYP